VNWYMTSFGQGAAYVGELLHMAETFAEQHPSVPAVIGVTPMGLTRADWWGVTNYKAKWLRDTYAVHGSRMLWIDADARVGGLIRPPEDCMIAANTYARLSSGVVWFGDGCGPLLDRWVEETKRSADDEEALIAAVAALRVDVAPLPDGLSAICDEGIPASIIHWNRSRAMAGHAAAQVINWPPSEEERRCIR